MRWLTEIDPEVLTDELAAFAEAPSLLASGASPDDIRRAYPQVPSEGFAADVRMRPSP